MKVILFCLTVFLIPSCSSSTNSSLSGNKEHLILQDEDDYDEGSKVDFGSLGKDDIKDLVLLGKVWGFLKYHHPAVASGKYNWDYELFRILPEYLDARKTSSRQEVLVNCIYDLGNIQVCNTCESATKFSYILPNHRWFDENTISEELSTSLHLTYDNRNQKEHYYIKQIPEIGNPEFLNEDDYKDFSYPDAGYRLLSIYRYWNIIEYFFPSKYLIEGNWDDVLERYIPDFVYARHIQK